MVKQKHTVQNHMPVLNAKETTTQPHVRKHQIHQQNVCCAEVITLQATKDVRCTRTCKKQRQEIEPNYTETHPTKN
jgi:hypothetical protein